VRVRKGLVEATSKIRETVTYRARNRSTHDRTLLIEHPFRAEFHVVGDDKPIERARNVYRFELKLAAGKSGQQRVVEEQDSLQTLSFNSLEDTSIQLYLKSTVVSVAVKEALRKALESGAD